MNTICILDLDKDSLAWLDELIRYLLALDEFVPRPVEIINLVRSTPRSAATFNFESLPTGRTNEYRIVLEPSEALLRQAASSCRRQGTSVPGPA